MIRFRGRSEINLDAKGRIAIPAKHRQVLTDSCQGEMVATVSPDPSQRRVIFYPRPYWEDVLEPKIDALGNDPRSRATKEIMLDYAEDLSMDANGRVLVPVSLRKYAQLEKQSVLIGRPNKIELWDQGLYEREVMPARENTLTGEGDQPESLNQLNW